MYMTESNLITCEPRASSAGKFGTVSSMIPPLGKLVIVTFSGSITTITLERCQSNASVEYERTHLVCVPRRSHIQNLAYAGIEHIGVKDRLRHRHTDARTEEVDCLWWETSSSQSRERVQAWIIPIPTHNDRTDTLAEVGLESRSYATTPVSMSLAIFRFDVTVYWRLSRPYSHWTGQ